MRNADSGNRPRVCEWILAGYFVYTLALAFLIPLEAAPRFRVCAASVGALAALHFVARFPARVVPEALRNIVPIPAVLLAYTQMGWFARTHEARAFEQAWVKWDRVLLDDWQLTRAVDSLGPFLPGLLEALYLMTYLAGPLGLLALYVTGHAGRADKYLSLFVASTVASYALYPYFPSDPPRTAFPDEMYGQYETVVRQLNWWILGKGGIHTSVFPSGHVSSAFGAGFGLLFALPESRRHGILMLLFAFGIAMATVYGRYHYAVDALAGIAVSCVASAVCVATFRRCVARERH